MENRASLCCKKTNNIDNDFEDFEEDPQINKPDLTALIKIQSLVRKFLMKIKIKKILPFSIDLIEGIKVEKDYTHSFEITDEKFSKEVNNLHKLEINLKDYDIDVKNLNGFSILYADNSYYTGQLNKNWKKE